jgi:hypothetical protein
MAVTMAAAALHIDSTRFPMEHTVTWVVWDYSQPLKVAFTVKLFMGMLMGLFMGGSCSWFVHGFSCR